MKDFICEYKKGTNLGELYLLPIDRRLYDVPEKPVISNYSTPKENFSSHYAHLEVGWPYIRDTEEFLKRLQNIQSRKIPTDTLVRMAEFLLTNNYFNLGEKYSIKFLELLLTRNLHDLTRAILWITLRRIFLK